MKKLLALITITLLFAVIVSSQDLQEFKAGKYSVSGKDLVNTSEGVKIGADEATFISWKPGKDDACQEQECLLSIKGFECLLTSDGQCKGVSKDKILLVVNQETEQTDLGKNTKLLYDLVTQEFTVLDKKFTFEGRDIASSSKITVVGNKISGDSFTWGEFQVSAKKGETAELTVDPNGVLAGKGTILDYRNIEFTGRNADYQICFNDKSCDISKTYIFMDTKMATFHESGKADGGPAIKFSNGNPFFGSQFSESASFDISNMENSDITISQRTGKIPYVDLKVSSGKTSTDNPNSPPAVFTNGQTTVIAFSNDVWLTNKEFSAVSSTAKLTPEQEQAMKEANKGKTVTDSVPMSVGIVNKQGKDLLGIASESDKKLIFSAYNSLGLATRGETETATDEKLSGIPQSSISESVIYSQGEYPPALIKQWLGGKLPNLNNVEGFNDADVKRMIDIFNDIPSPLTSNLKSIKFVTDDEAMDAQCDANCAAWVDKRGNMFVKKQGIDEATISHELIHVGQEMASRNDPQIGKLVDDYEKLVIQYAEMQSKMQEPEEAVNPANIAALKKLDDQAEAIWSQRDKAYAQIPLINEWMQANNVLTMKSNPTEYCGGEVVQTDEGATWKDGTSGPRYGVMRPYGCKNVQEDMATSIEDLDTLASQVSCDNGQPNVYAKKIYILKKYGWLDSNRYELLLPQATRDCIGLAMK